MSDERGRDTTLPLSCVFRPGRLSATGLCVRRGDADVLHAITLAIEPGEHVALVGPNGSGKTTLLLALKGVLPLRAGAVHLDDAPVEPFEPRVGLVFANPEDQGVCPIVEDDVAFGLENRAWAPERIRASVYAVLRQLGLWELRAAPIHTLSGGEAQKVALASVLALGASHLLLDEATSMLSPWERDSLLATIAALRREGVGVLQVTHQPEELLWAGRVVALVEGSIAFDGTPAAYFASTQRLWDPPPLERLRERLDAEGAALPPLDELVRWLNC